jgi:hypothetical protein
MLSDTPGLMRQFASLPSEYYEGHEFLTIKPTSKLSGLAEICEQALESADDLWDIPGFGALQIDAQWVAENNQQPTTSDGPQGGTASS